MHPLRSLVGFGVGVASRCAPSGWIGLVLPLFGCVLPFVHSHREEPRTPAAVQRFSSEAQALARSPGAPTLSAVTRSMSDAIEALPKVDRAGQLAKEVRKQADAMTQAAPDEADVLARASLRTALGAARSAQASVSQGDKDYAVEAAHQAVENIAPGQRATVNFAFAAVAHAMVVASGERAPVATGSELSQLVARFAVEERDEARRTGAQAIAAMGDALQDLPRPPEHAGRTADELRKRAKRLATAEALDYAEQLKSALTLAVDSLDHAPLSPAQRRLVDEAKPAVAAIRADRPLELQQATMVEALRLLTDAIDVGVTAH
jgi:hypothetical protein